MNPCCAPDRDAVVSYGALVWGQLELLSLWGRILLAPLTLHNTDISSLLSTCKLAQGPRSANKFAGSVWQAWRFGRILGKYLPASASSLLNTSLNREMLSLMGGLGVG